jgi:hypothetical protein
MSIRDWFPGSPTEEETIEINKRAAIATVDKWGNFDEALKRIGYMDMWRRQALARLVDRIPWEAGSYGIAEENKARVQVVLDAPSYKSLKDL